MFAILMKIAVSSLGNGPCLSLSWKTWTHFSCLKLSLEFAKKIGYIFWEFEFFNVAKFPALARLIIRYSILTLLQISKIYVTKKFRWIYFVPFAFGFEGSNNFSKIPPPWGVVLVDVWCVRHDMRPTPWALARGNASCGARGYVVCRAERRIPPHPVVWCSWICGVMSGKAGTNTNALATSSLMWRNVRGIGRRNGCFTRNIVVSQHPIYV